MKRINASTIKDSTTKIMVKVTVNQIASGKFNIYAMPIDEKGNNLLGYPVRRVENTQSEAEKRMNTIARIAAQKALPSPSATRAKATKAVESNIIHDTVKKLLEEGVNVHPKTGGKYGWSPSVCRSVMTYFLNHGFAEFWTKNSESSDYKAELRKFRDQLIEKAVASGKSKGVKARAEETVDTVLKRIQILCDYLQKEYFFPAISFVDGIVMGKAVPEEQIKCLPDNVYIPFCKELERRVLTEPRMVLGAVLMADAGLRTAEAAGTPVANIIIKNGYGVVAVTYQEKQGVRIEKLKSQNGYRIVILSHWGAWLVGRCLDKLGWTEDTEELITTSNKLSAWVKQLLNDIDIELVNTATRVEAANPDQDDDGSVIFDVSAYVLRRNTASRWLNYDGLTHEEIDIMLGHKHKNKEEQLYLTDEQNQETIARKLERYVHNPEHTGNPAFAPIQLDEKTNQEMRPFQIMRLKNVTDKTLVVVVDAENTESWDTITCTIPMGSGERTTPRSFGRRRKRTEIIGNNYGTFDYGKESKK